MMAAFCSNHIFCIDCRLFWERLGGVLLVFAAGLDPVPDFVFFIGSAWVGLDGPRLRLARVASPWKDPDDDDDDVGELLLLLDAGPV